MFRKILVALDRSHFAEQALGPATTIARASGAGIDLVMVHEPRPLARSPDVAWHAGLIDSEAEYLAEFQVELEQTASIAATYAVLRGEVVSAICKRMRDVEADLVVITSHGRTGLNRARVGSVADGLLRQSGIPVLMCRPRAKTGRRAAFVPFNRILVPLDGSASATDVMQSAISLAKCSGARLTLLRIVQPVKLLTVETAILFAFPVSAEDDISTERVGQRVTRVLAEMARDVSAKTSLEVDSHVVIAHDIPQAIIDFALKNAVDGIAMSTHGRGASRLFFGSVADKMIRAVALPLLLQGPAAKVNKTEFLESEELLSTGVL